MSSGTSRRCNLDCNFYFFKHGEKTRSTASGLFRTLAFQMAESCFGVRHALVAMIDDDEKLNREDHYMIWNKLFLNRIFKVESLPPQFWVIDALDECSSKGVASIVTVLSQLDVRLPIRIMITSRPGGQLERLFTQEKTPFYEVTTGQDGSIRGYRAVLEGQMPSSWHLPGVSESCLRDSLPSPTEYFFGHPSRYHGCRKHTASRICRWFYAKHRWR